MTHTTESAATFEQETWNKKPVEKSKLQLALELEFTNCEQEYSETKIRLTAKRKEAIQGLIDAIYKNNLNETLRKKNMVDYIRLGQVECEIKKSRGAKITAKQIASIISLSKCFSYFNLLVNSDSDIVDQELVAIHTTIEKVFSKL